MLTSQSLKFKLKKEKLTKTEYKTVRSYQKVLKELDDKFKNTEEGTGRRFILGEIRELLGTETICNLSDSSEQIHKIFEDLNFYYANRNVKTQKYSEQTFQRIIDKSKNPFFAMFKEDTADFTEVLKLKTLDSISINSKKFKKKILKILENDVTFSKSSKNKLEFDALFDISIELTEKIKYLKKNYQNNQVDFRLDYLQTQAIRGLSTEEVLLQYPFLVKEIMENGVDYPLSFPIVYNKLLSFLEKENSQEVYMDYQGIWQIAYSNTYYNEIKDILSPGNFENYTSYYTSAEHYKNIMHTLLCLNGPDKKLNFVTINKKALLYPSYYTLYEMPTAMIGLFSLGVLSNTDITPILDFIILNTKQLAFLANDLELKNYFCQHISLKLANTPAQVKTLPEVLKVIYNFIVTELGLTEGGNLKERLIEHKLFVEPKFQITTWNQKIYHYINHYLTIPAGDGTRELAPSVKSLMALVCFVTVVAGVIYIKSIIYPN